MNIGFDARTLLEATLYSRTYAGISRYIIEFLRASKFLEPEFKIKCGMFTDNAFEGELTVAFFEKEWPDFRHMIFEMYDTPLYLAFCRFFHP